MMKFFSDGAWRPSAREIAEIPTPVGESCLACGVAIQVDDCGVSMVHMDASGGTYRPWHLACFRDALDIDKIDKSPSFVLRPGGVVEGPLPIDFADLHAAAQAVPNHAGGITWDALTWDAIGEWPRPDVPESDEATTSDDHEEDP